MSSVRDGRRGSWGLILGCSQGTGASICRAIAADGMNVIGIHRGNHPEAAARLVADVEAHGVRCQLLTANAGKLEVLDELVAAVGAIAGPGGVGLMVHSLADGSVGRLVDPDAPEQALVPKQILKTFDVMAHSFLFWTQRLFGGGWLGDGARIVALLNYLDEAVLPGGGAIGPSKAALTTYVRFLAGELAPHGVRVNGIRFGAADTYAASMVPDFEKALAAFADINPMGRNVSTDDVGRFVALLLDERADFLNGAIVSLDGGEERAMIQGMFRR